MRSVVFSPSGKLVLTGSDDNIARLWGVSSGNELKKFVGHDKGLKSVAFSAEHWFTDMLEAKITADEMTYSSLINAAA